ncbi:hypothetical protein CR513_18450, partial [Mucuna pruriens]
MAEAGIIVHDKNYGQFFLKRQLFSFKMDEDKLDEDMALILLSALPRSYEHFKNAILFGRDQTITLDEVQTSIRTKEF